MGLIATFSNRFYLKRVIDQGIQGAYLNFLVRNADW